jgi:hypothetical protein
VSRTCPTCGHVTGCYGPFIMGRVDFGPLDLAALKPGAVLALSDLEDVTFVTPPPEVPEPTPELVSLLQRAYAEVASRYPPEVVAACKEVLDKCHVKPAADAASN